jgi:hypothetical protein
MAIMNYFNFHQEVVVRYSVDIKGWPFPKFANPTAFGNSIPPLLELREALASKRCHFVKLTSAELSEKIAAYQTDVTSGDIVPAVRKKRKDAGQPCKKFKTAEVIENDSSDSSSSSSSDDSDDSSSSSSSDEDDDNHVKAPVRKSVRTIKAPSRRGIPQPITSATACHPLEAAAASNVSKSSISTSDGSASVLGKCKGRTGKGSRSAANTENDENAPPVKAQAHRRRS